MTQGKITLLGVLLTLLVAVVSATVATDASPAAARKAALDAWLESWNTGKGDVERFLSDDVAFTGPFNVTNGLEAYRDLIRRGRTVFSPLELKIDELLLDGDRVVVAWSVKATHAVLDKPVDMRGASILHFAGKKIKSEWRLYDGAELCRQLGGTVNFP